ncbi:MAG: family 2A encapsulin nanocompartment cargo protein cysteine desulfurase [Terracidiphilus sp.]
MSTSNPTPTPEGRAESARWASGLGPGAALPAGVPSPAELTRLANEIFNALPQDAQLPAAKAAAAVLPPNSAFSGNPHSAVPGPTAPAVPGLLAGLADPTTQPFVTTPDRNTTPDLRSNAAAPPHPTIPGGGIDPYRGPAFAFLADARPIFVEPHAESRPVNSPSNAFFASVPSDEGFAAIPFSLVPDAPASQPAQPSQIPLPPAPTVPGAFGVVDSSAIPAFSFLEEARPLFSTPPAIPGPVPSAVAPQKSAAEEEKAASASNPFAAPLAPATPQLAGTVAHPLDFRAPASQEPDGQPRSLYPANVGTVVAPIVTPGADQTPILGDLGLSSYSFDVEAIRRDFPILRETVNGHPLIWLDNGATSQKPQSVIDRVAYFYEHENSNVHRAAHELAARATDAYESAREKTRRFLNAGATREVVFVRGATEAINLIAQSWGLQNIQQDDEIVITWLEHHANIVPWQMLCAKKGAKLRIAPVDDSGQVLLDEYEKLLGPKTRLVSIAHVSNALGTIVPVNAMTEAAHRHGARVLVDGAQAVSHMRVDVQAIGCDFYVFSGHKVFAPTGIGVVYGKSEVLDNMPPWQGGGNMIQDVTFEKTLYQPPPQRFEAGTGSIADAVGLGAAIDYLDRVGIANVSRHEHMLLAYATAALDRIPGLHIIGTAKEKAGVLSFVIDGFRTEEIGDYLNRKGIAVRGGHHCAQPILRRFGLESTVRATFALYNTCEEVDALVAALWDLRQGRNPGLA